MNKDIVGENLVGIQLRMMPPLVKHNGGYSFWSPDTKVNLYCLTLIFEDIDGRFNGLLCLDSFSGVGDNEFLNVYKALYDWKGNSATTAPDRIFFISTIVRCKRKPVDIDIILHNTRKSKNYRELVDMLSSMVSDTVSFPQIVNVAMKITDVIKQNMGKIDNVSVATTAHYFNKHHGDLDKIGAVSIKNATKNVIFDFELTIYNKELITADINNTVATLPANIYPM